MSTKQITLTKTVHGAAIGRPSVKGVLPWPEEGAYRPNPRRRRRKPALPVLPPIAGGAPTLPPDFGERNVMALVYSKLGWPE